MLGVRADGRKELVAITDGYRESTESWADLLRDCKRRGMTAPVLAVGDGALGFWNAVREVFPATREQRCWFHKQANVLAARACQVFCVSRLFGFLSIVGVTDTARCGLGRPARVVRVLSSS